MYLVVCVTELCLHFNSPLPPHVYLILRSYFNCFFIHVLIISIYLAHRFNPGVISAAATPPSALKRQLIAAAATVSRLFVFLFLWGRYSRCKQCNINNLGGLALKWLMF